MHRHRRRGDGVLHGPHGAQRVHRRQLQLIGRRFQHPLDHLLLPVFQGGIPAVAAAHRPQPVSHRHGVMSAHRCAPAGACDLHAVAVILQHSVRAAPAQQPGRQRGIGIRQHLHGLPCRRGPPSPGVRHPDLRRESPRLPDDPRLAGQGLHGLPGKLHPAGPDAAAPDACRRHLKPQAAVSPDAHAPSGQYGVVVDHPDCHAGRGLHILRHIQPHGAAAAPHHRIAGIGSSRQHAVPGHGVGHLLRQGQRRRPRNSGLPGLFAHRTPGIAYLIADPVGILRIVPLHQDAARLAQGHGPGLQHRRPGDHRQRHGLGHGQTPRSPLGGEPAVPRGGQGRAAAAVRPVIHRHRPGPQLIPALLLVPVRVIHGFPLQNIPAAVGRLVVRLPGPIVDVQRQGQGRPVFRRILAYGIVQPQPPPGGGHRPVNTRHFTLRSTGRPAPKPW